MGDGGGSLASVELFDPARNAVQELDALAGAEPVIRRLCSVAVAYSSLAATTASTWRPSRFSSRQRGADGRALVIGGADRMDRMYYATTEIYNPEAAAFETGPLMANRRYRIAGTSVILPGGDLLVAAGAPVAEILDIGSVAFREVPGGFPDAYRFAAVAPLRGGRCS